MYMILFVLNDPALTDKVLESWTGIGVSGATILESTGLHRRQNKHIPMRYTYGSDFPDGEMGNTTLLVIVENEGLVQECLRAAEQVAGDLNNPETGVFAAWPLSFAKGIPTGR